MGSVLHHLQVAGRSGSTQVQSVAGHIQHGLPLVGAASASPSICDNMGSSVLTLNTSPRRPEAETMLRCPCSCWFTALSNGMTIRNVHCVDDAELL